MRNDVKDGWVSVLIPNYNGGVYLRECLDSLLEQTYQKIEICVIDNASSDDSVSLIEKEYSTVAVIPLKNNRGFAAAVNAGIGVARGEFVVMLNNDTQAAPDFIEELHRALAEEPEAAMAAPKILFARDRGTINSMGLGYSIAGTNHDIGFGLSDGSVHEEREWILGPCGGAGMYRRKLIEDIGILDEDFFMYYEDVDYSLRAQLAGYKCISVPTAKVYHVEGGSGSALPMSRHYYFARNSLAVIAKNFPTRVLFRNVHLILWEIAKRTGSPLVKGDVSALRGYGAGLARIIKCMKERRAIQQSRRVPDSYIENMLKKNLNVLREINLQRSPAGELQ